MPTRTAQHVRREQFEIRLSGAVHDVLETDEELTYAELVLCLANITGRWAAIAVKVEREKDSGESS